jgi:hypothetical protein
MLMLNPNRENRWREQVELENGEQVRFCGFG